MLSIFTIQIEKGFDSNTKYYSKVFKSKFDFNSFNYHYSNQILIQILSISNTFEQFDGNHICLSTANIIDSHTYHRQPYYRQPYHQCHIMNKPYIDTHFVNDLALQTVPDRRDPCPMGIVDGNDGRIGLSDSHNSPDSQIFVIFAHENWANREVDLIQFVICPISSATP